MLYGLVRFVSLRGAAQKPVKTALTVLGIALGVALFVAIRSINDSTLSFFRENVTAIAGASSLTVFGGETGFGEDKVDVVKGVPGVKAAVPTIETRVRFENASRRRQTLVVLGIDFLQESSVRSYKANSDVLADPLEFLNQADSIVVTASFAAENKVALESTLDLLTAHGKKTFVVRGVLTAEGAAAAYGGAIALMDIDGARASFGKEGKVDRIDIVAADGEDERALAHRIESALGPGYRVDQKEGQSEAFARMVGGYQRVLAFLSLLALLVGTCLVANTVTLAVLERRREIAVLRALGASRNMVLISFVLEAALLGVMGGIIGVVLGRGLAEVLVERVSQSMSRQYVTPIEVSDIQFKLEHVLLGVGAGTFSAVLAALLPAWRASTVRGSEAFGAVEDAAAGSSSHRRVRIARAVGASTLVVLFVCSWLHLELRFPVLETVYPILGGVGTALVAPSFVTGGITLLARLQLFERMPVMRLASENLLLNPSRTGTSVLSLVVGLMLVIVMGTVHQSFERSIGEWQERTFRTDLIVSSSGRVLSLEVQPLAESLAAEIDRVRGVDVRDGQGARAIRVVRVPFGGRQVAIKALDRPHPRVGFSFLDATSGTADEAGRALYTEGANNVLVSENFVAHFGKRVGDDVTFETPNGAVTFRIAGTVVEFSHPDGTVYMARDTYKRVWNDSLVTAFAVEATPGTPVEAVRRAIDAELGDRGLVGTMNGELKKQLDDVIGESLAYTRAIEAAALGVGLLGLLSTLLMSIVERMRELGMLRAIGMSRFQLVRMVVAEAALLGSFGGIAAAVLGAYVARLWVVSSLASSLGWTIAVHVPWSAVGSTLSLGVVVGVIAGAISSRRVAYLPIREALVCS